ncbi:sulfatase-like hydrolase/transferase [bacterium]|nr:sulfatase-like hydrolase/transferase [bacterium]
MKKIIPVVAATLLIAITTWFLFKKRSEKHVFSDANVLLITIDTIRPDYLSCYGSSNKTPNIDQLANRGILFENAFCQVPLTFPSHTSILTGLFPTRHGVHQNGLEIFNKKEELITAAFRANGYRTGAVISSFVLDRKFGLADGFDVYDDRMERMPTLTSNFEVERRGDETVSAASKILEKFRAEKWFLWIHFYDPHTPYNPGYAQEISFVDQQIGRLMDWLQERKLTDRLVVALLGDHGESLGEHGEKTHGFFVYNSTLKIPMILAYPDSKQKRVSNIVAAVDVAPTLLQLAGIQDLRSRDGHSLFQPRKADVYFESRYAELLGWNGLQGLIRENWKLIATTRSELYDLSGDSHERNNLYSAQQDISRPMKRDLTSMISISAKAATPDQETLEKLKSLGYISVATVPKQNRTEDPKDKIALWSRYESSLEAKPDSQEKVELLQALVREEPNNNFFRLSLASHYRQLKNLNAAAEQLQQAIQNDPSDPNAYHELAVTYREMKNYGEALRAAEAALAIQPQRSEFHGIRAMIRVETGRFAEAKAEFVKVLQMDPNNAVAWNNLGNAHRELNELEKAAEAYRKAIELSPHYAYPENGLATVLVRQKQTREAFPHFENALRLDPRFVEVYLNMAIAFHSLNEHQRAKTLYLTFLKIAPDWMKQEKANAQLLLSQLP